MTKTIIKERWIDIKGYNGAYLVSSHGRVFSMKNKLIMKPSRSGSGIGYPSILLYINNVPKRQLIHRLVATHFIKNPNGLSQVNHKDANRLNNRVENLEWCTPSQNIQHAISNRLLMLNGEHQPISKLSFEDVQCIRYLHGALPTNVLSYYFGVCTSTIHNVITNKTWKHGERDRKR